MKTIRLLVPLALMALSAFPQDVRYNFAADQDFSKFKTYRWVAAPGPQVVDELTDGQIKAAIDAELATKGLMKTDSPTSDLAIMYQVALGQEKQITMYNDSWGYGPGWRGGWYGGGSGFSTGQTSTIMVGQLDLDIYDAATKKLIWRGTVTKTLDPKAKPEKRQKNLQKAMAKLLKNYPPPKKT